MHTDSRKDAPDLFNHPATHKRLFSRIKEIVGAKFVHGRLYILLKGEGPALPLPWLRSLTVKVSAPARGVEEIVKVDTVTGRDGDLTMLRTHLLASKPADGRPAADMSVVLQCGNGRSVSVSMESLLDANP